MTDVVLVAIVGVLGTVAATVSSTIGNSIIESKKAKNERQMHIATSRFNREFDMYQQLCEKHLTMVYDVGTAVMLTRGAVIPGSTNSNKDLVQLSARHIDEADRENKRSAPFISKEIFEDYKELGNKTYKAISMFDLWCKFDCMEYHVLKYNGEEYTKGKAETELEERQKEVSQYSDMILEKLRKYLEKRENQ